MYLSEGPVLEMGMGVFSTPLLHWLCLDQKRQMVSYDNKREFYEMNKTFESPAHQILYVENDDWAATDIDKPWGMVFVDHHPGIRRGVDAIRLANRADYVVIHDSDMLHEHGYEDIYRHFKYAYNWKRRKPYTTILSNFYRLDNL
jgi:hypothetical protein